MAAKINLLPTELAPSKGVSTSGKALNRIAMFMVGILIVAIASGGGLILFFSNQLTNESQKQTDLKATISSLQNTETQLVLLKDRLDKIQSVLDQRTNESAFNNQQSVVAAMPQSITFQSSNTESGESELQLNMPQSSEFRDLMGQLLSRTDLKSVVIQDLTFSSISGYKLILQLI